MPKYEITTNAASASDYDNTELITLGEGRVYYISKNGEGCLRISCDKTTCPFDTAILFNDYVCISAYDEVIFLHLEDHKVKRVNVPLYVGYFHVYNNTLLILSATGICAYNNNLEKLWENNSLAIDGVILHEINEDYMIVLCEMDPPDGWTERKLNIKNGQEIL